MERHCDCRHVRMATRGRAHAKRKLSCARICVSPTVRAYLYSCALMFMWQNLCGSRSDSVLHCRWVAEWVHVCIRVRMCMCQCITLCESVYGSKCTRVFMCAYTHTQRHTHAHTHAHTLPQPRPCTHSRTHPATHTKPLPYTCTHCRGAGRRGACR